MRVRDGQQVLMRIFIGEDDRLDGKPLYRALLELLRKEGIAGATILRGVAGFGAKSVVHGTHLLRLSQDLPMVIEVVDTQEHIDRVLPLIDARVNEGLITLEKVHVIRYASGRD